MSPLQCISDNDEDDDNKVDKNKAEKKSSEEVFDACKKNKKEQEWIDKNKKKEKKIEQISNITNHKDNDNVIEKNEKKKGRNKNKKFTETGYTTFKNKKREKKQNNSNRVIEENKIQERRKKSGAPIIEIFDSRLGLETKNELEKIGTVLHVGNGVVRIFGTAQVEVGELIVFENGRKGISLSLVEVAVLGSTRGIKEGDTVSRTKRTGSNNKEGVLGSGVLDNSMGINKRKNIKKSDQVVTTNYMRSNEGFNEEKKEIKEKEALNERGKKKDSPEMDKIECIFDFLTEIIEDSPISYKYNDILDAEDRNEQQIKKDESKEESKESSRYGEENFLKSMVNNSQKNYQKTVSVFISCLGFHQSALGIEHPQTLQIVQNLSKLYTEDENLFQEGFREIKQRVIIDIDGKRGIYSGLIAKKSGLQHGKGCFKYNDGCTFVGKYKYGARIKGEFTYQDGSNYNGTWLNGMRHGKGKFISKDGGWYDGEWVEDRKQGRGKRMSMDGNIYEGKYFKDKKHGKGTMKYADGHVFDGEYKNGQMVNGKTTFVFERKP